MKVLIPFLMIALTIADLILYRGAHLEIIASWIKPILVGIRTGGNIWGA